MKPRYDIVSWSASRLTPKTMPKCLFDTSFCYSSDIFVIISKMDNIWWKFCPRKGHSRIRKRKRNRFRTLMGVRSSCEPESGQLSSMTPLLKDERFLTECFPKYGLIRSKEKMFIKDKPLKKHSWQDLKIVTLTCFISVSYVKVAWLSLKLSKIEFNYICPFPI